jgi:hypothetical protein
MNDVMQLDDSLALLSLRVAQEVDRKLSGHQSDPEVFQNFRNELSKASGIGEAQSTAFLHADPTTTEVFAQAIGDASDQPVSDISSLSNAVMRIIEPLGGRRETLSDRDLENVKTFCLSLHKSIMAHRLPPLFEGDNSLEDELRFTR